MSEPRDPVALQIEEAARANYQQYGRGMLIVTDYRDGKARWKLTMLWLSDLHSWTLLMMAKDISPMN